MPTAPASRSRRAATWTLVVAAVAVVVLLVVPIRTTLIRSGIVLAVVVVVGASRVLLPPRGRRVLEGSAAGVVAWGGATWTPVTPTAERFTAALMSYEGTPYVWGGETARGIDCSGLIRAALIDTQLSAGRAGAALRLWWTDAAARDFAPSHPWLLRGPERRESIAAAGTAPPRGAIAVTFNGLHILAHLGAGRWIQASPNDHRVTIRDAAEPDPWFAVPVDLWTLRER